MAQANAVEARTLLDLRIGAAFTRFQSLQLQQRFEQLKGDVISYGKSLLSKTELKFALTGSSNAGPCQFPTLGFVVQRYNQVKSFVPETFWYIYLALTRIDEVSGEETETPFTWRRGHLFDLEPALALYEHVLDNPMARVTKVTNKNTKKLYVCFYLEYSHIAESDWIVSHCRSQP
jgi:DNA topoisomerase III